MMKPGLENYIHSVIPDFDQIDPERKAILEKIKVYISEKMLKNKSTNLIYICTHNSRRSHLSQIWAQAAAFFYDIPNINTFSGGTEATAFNPRAVDSMQEAGFKIKVKQNGSNPLYEVIYSEMAPPVMAWSKKYDHENNPKENFCAIMTCSDADKNCPFIPGAELRISLPYDDPKDFDGTAREREAYRERSKQIAIEMLYLFSTIKK